MLLDYTLGQTSIVLRVKVRNSSVATGAGLTGLTNASSGLIISTIADNEASATAYTVAASHVQTIAALGTYAAPSASNCRFAEVDSTNHPGIYELQIADARFAVSSAKSLLISLSGAANMAQCDVIVPLRTVNPYSAAFGLSIAKTTNITGFNDIAATAIVSAGAITTSGGAVSTVTTVGTLTTYTGNTPQTGDSFARIGATGSGLTSLAPSSTALSTAQWTNGRATNLDNLDAAVSTRSVYAGGAVASVTGAVGSVTSPVTVTLTQTLNAARELDAIADTSLTVNDALQCAVAGVTAQVDASSGTSLIFKTASTGQTLRTKTLTLISPPGTVPDKAV